MDKICIIGDSIRMGYEPILREITKGKLEVVADSSDNGRFVQYELYQLNQLLLKNPGVKIVFFNSGYWDMNREEPMSDPFNPPHIYKEGLKRIIELIRSQNIVPIFLTTPPIYNPGNSKDNTGVEADIHYQNEWVIEYNKVALDLMKEQKVEVIDVVEPLLKGDKYYKCPDMLHLTYEGYLIIANMVKKRAFELLNIE